MFFFAPLCRHLFCHFLTTPLFTPASFSNLTMTRCTLSSFSPLFVWTLLSSWNISSTVIGKSKGTAVLYYEMGVCGIIYSWLMKYISPLAFVF